VIETMTPPGVEQTPGDVARGARRRVIETMTPPGVEQMGIGQLGNLSYNRDVDTSRQWLDSTAIRSAMRGPTRLGIMVEMIAKFLRELRRLRPALHAQVEFETVRKYINREEAGCFTSTKPSELKRRLPEAANLLILVAQFRDSEAVGLARLPARSEGRASRLA
jgi:hypothetical protein